MTTIGYALLFLAFIVGRAAARGRGVTDVPTDIGDLVLAAVTGDYADVEEVLARTGDNTVAAKSLAPLSDRPKNGEAPAASAPSSDKGSAVLAEMKRLGSGSRYVLGATGPSAYDCSGLVYRAMVNVAGYTGPRFTTASWFGVGGQVSTKVAEPAVGDVVLWPGHMGVVDGPDSFYSALSPQSGIKSLKMSILTKQKGAQPTFWRLK